MRKLPLLSLCELGPIKLVPKGHLLVVLKSYFDGGNQADDKQYDRITLATAAGTCDEWRGLESAWNEALVRHGAKFLHTTDAIGLQKEFSKKKGWTDDRVDKLISDCVNVVAQHMVIPGKILVPGPYGERLNFIKPGVNITTLTIPLKDYRKARRVNPKMPNSVTEICATESLGFCFKWGKIIGADWYELFFDQGEPFFGHICDRHQNKKSKRAIPLMAKVVHLGQSNMKAVPALQVADLFAWCTNHIGDVRRDWHNRLNHLDWFSLILDYPRLLKPIPGALERTAAWKLPTRRLERISPLLD
jgi:hypothetical protein